MASTVGHSEGNGRMAVAVLGGSFAAGLAAVRLVDPNVPGSWPVCPSVTWLGVLCPLCGGLRSTHALLHGDLAGSLSSNLFAPLVIAVVVAVLVGWWRRPTSTALPAWLSGRVLGVATLVAVAYGILRNLEGMPWAWLAP